MNSQFHYDTVRYPSNVFAHFRPDLVGAMAALHGVRPARIENCRTLELGCGDGASLLSIAYAMPESECVGVDLSAKRIAEAKLHAAEIGLPNVEFHHMDLMDFDPERFGKFDFIIAHGLFSWVPPFVREKLLRIYKDCLAATGVGFISYNAYPGWYLGQMVRDAGRFAIGEETVTLELAERAFEFLQIAAATGKPCGVYEAVMKSEVEKISAKDREVFMHDELSDFNQPFYISDFISQISKMGLAYVAEADPVMQFTAAVNPGANGALDAYINEPTKREQCLDFLRGTRFRSTLISHVEAGPRYLPDETALEGLLFTTESLPASPSCNFLDDSTVEFTSKSGSPFSTNFPFTKTFLKHLSDNRPLRVPFATAVSLLQQHFGGRDDFDEKLDIFRRHVIDLYHAEIVEITCFEPRVAHSVSDRPSASAFVKWQMASGFPFVTTPGGRNIKFEDEAPRWILQKLDGEHTLAEVSESLKGNLEGNIPSDADIRKIVDECTNRLCSLGLLVS